MTFNQKEAQMGTMTEMNDETKTDRKAISIEALIVRQVTGLVRAAVEETEEFIDESNELEARLYRALAVKCEARARMMERWKEGYF